jgi:hypothetical protein
MILLPFLIDFFCLYASTWATSLAGRTHDAKQFVFLPCE